MLKTLLVRGTVLWFLARLMAMAIQAWIAASGRGLPAAGVDSQGSLVPLWTLAVTSALVFVDLRRRKEFMLLHNLGVSTSSAVLTGSIPAFTLEVVLGMVVR